MKRYIVILLAMALGTMLSSTLKAQELQVYSVSGAVKMIQGKTSTQISPRQTLTMETVVNCSAGSRLVLIDESAKKQYTLSATGTFSIAKLIAQSQNSTKSLSDKYMAYLMKQISGKGVLTSKTAIDDTFASIERETNDSTFIVTPDVLTNPNDTIQQ